jgi:hypothetical protein
MHPLSDRLDVRPGSECAEGGEILRPGRHVERTPDPMRACRTVGGQDEKMLHRLRRDIRTFPRLVPFTSLDWHQVPTEHIRLIA